MFELIKPGSKYDFLGKRRIFIIVSTVMCLAILVGVFTVGLNYGIDFAGGTNIQVKIEPAAGMPVPDAAGITEVVKSLGLAEPEVQHVGSAGNQFLVGLKRVTSDVNQTHIDALKNNLGLAPGIGAEAIRRVELSAEGGDRIALHFTKDVDETLVMNAIQAAGITEFDLVKRGREGESREFLVKLKSLSNNIKNALAKKYGTVTVESSESVGPRAGEKLRTDGVKAILFSLIGILFYVGFRFDFRFAPGAIVALIHDAIVTVGFYLVTRTEFNLTSIAVVLTIVGYSVNDTIVIYDRIRENQARLRDKRLEHLINISLNETLGRTLLTNLTVFLSIIAVPIIASGSIRDFALALLVGIVAGTYSTIYIASPIVIWLDEKLFKRKGLAASASAASAASARRPGKKVEEEEEEELEASSPETDSGDEPEEEEDEEEEEAPRPKRR